MALSADWVRPSRSVHGMPRRSDRQVTRRMVQVGAGRQIPRMNDTRALTRALYGAISGPAGAPRNWQLQDSLFAPGACSYVLHTTAEGDREAEVLTVREYRLTRQPYFDANDFYEVEVGHHAQVRGNAAVVFSDYESRRSPDGPAFDRGTNTIMLIRLGGEWRITSISWEAGPIATALWRKR